ncbi:hypothetical protein BCR32DRAFT_278088 [Anaeromyces robustus]|uniref:Uncharacterized protein n=1 Tax=Anaeromyces robustus TaxID=1754192 RepID=A0A1Y1XCC6_9FUNG|nr:hypothetical protein BCR32DRAFT_278088 [Anaeromyces robustus]|eukprot:ORX83388.1 hypothetical protein BCR32DRAFT_278088 [Anaeromyces robustus]
MISASSADICLGYITISQYNNIVAVSNVKIINQGYIVNFNNSVTTYNNKVELQPVVLYNKGNSFTIFIVDDKIYDNKIA